MKYFLYVLLAMVFAVPAFSAGEWSIIRQADFPTHFRDVTYADAQHAWAVGDSGVIAATSDGGKTWSAQNSGVKQNLRCIMFIDPKNGWISGDE